MKPSHEWTEEDIQGLIQHQIQESSELDYKHCSALRTEGHVYDKKTDKYIHKAKLRSKDKLIIEISKDVSSFANAAGGTIVYGVVEDNHLPLHIDQYPFDPNVESREWLENIIDSNIRRKIEGVKINQILLDQTNPGKVIYAVYIPQSLQGAHQAKDYRYYQRRNFKAEPMEDYQVRDVMNRFRNPILRAEVEFDDVDTKSEKHRHAFGIKLINIGNMAAVNFGIDIYFPVLFLDGESLHEAVLVYSGLREGIVTKEYRGYRKFSYRNFGQEYVLFPSEEIILLDAHIKTKRIEYFVDMSNYEKCHLYKIKWTIFADNMPPVTEEHNLREIF